MAMPADEMYGRAQAAMEARQATTAEDRPAAARKASSPARREGILSQITPPWAKNTAGWFFAQHDPAWLGVGVVLSIAVLIPLGALLLGLNGWASIQGVRLTAARAGLAVQTTGIPGPSWWALPVVLFFVQTFARHIPEMRWLWRPAISYDGVTTGVGVFVGAVYILFAILGGIIRNIWRGGRRNR